MPENRITSHEVFSDFYLHTDCLNGSWGRGTRIAHIVCIECVLTGASGPTSLNSGHSSNYSSFSNKIHWNLSSNPCSSQILDVSQIFVRLMSPRGGMTKSEKPCTAMGAWHPLLAWLCLTCCGQTWAVPSVACPDVQQGTLQVKLGQLDVSSQGSSKDCWRISIIPHISIQHVSKIVFCYLESMLV